MSQYRERIDRAMLDLRTEVERQLSELATEVGEAALEYALRDTPIQSSDLIQGWELIYEDNGFVLRNDTSYAGIVKDEAYQEMLTTMPEYITDRVTE